MTVSLQTSENDFLLKVKRIASLGSPVVQVQRISGGGNNRIFKAQCEDGKSYCVKFYFSSLNDQRDRLGTEYSSLKFIYEQGIDDVPQAYIIDRAELMGIYGWIDGQNIIPGTVTANDIGSAVSFLARLESLSHLPQANQFNTASEGCFCVADIIGHIELKLQKFQACSGDTEELRRLRNYLQGDLIPFLKESSLWARENWGNNGADQAIEARLRTLSPSDFGFHNALRVSNSQVKYLDFEYFGWDDPAKMIVDFILHPAMDLSDALKQSFYQNMLIVFKGDPSLRTRVACYYPLLGLKWCLIILNEFLKDDLKRRQFAMVDAKDTVSIQQRQLKKAEDLIERLRSSYKRFPYES